jgi:DNA-binding IclR family transcriptional regulator
MPVSSAVMKAFRVLRLLRRTPGPLSLTEVSRSLKIAPSSAHSILNELLDQGAVTQDPDKRYRLGPSTFYLGAAFARGVPIYRGIWNDLVAIARELSLTAVIAVPWEGHHLILSVHQSGGSDVDVAFGGRVPLDAGSWGQAYHVWADATPLGELHSYTAKSITDAGEYNLALGRARLRGYATDNEEFTTGVGAVTSGVTSERGYEGIASLVGPIAHMSEIGFDVAGRRLASLVSRGSFALGDPGRIRVVGSE